MMVLKNPALLDIAEAHGKQADTEGAEDDKVEDKWHGVLTMHSPMEHVCSIGQGEHVGERLEKYRQFLDWEKEAAEENHGKAEKV